MFDISLLDKNSNKDKTPIAITLQQKETIVVYHLKMK